MTITDHKRNNNHPHCALQFVFAARFSLLTTSRMLLIHKCPFLFMTQFTTHNEICKHVLFQKLEIMGQETFLSSISRYIRGL